MADLSGFSPSQFISPVRKNNVTFREAERIVKIMNDLGMVNFGFYLLSGRVTCSKKAFLKEFPHVEDGRYNCYISLDKYDPDLESEDYTPPTNDMNVGRIMEILSDKDHMNAALRLADIYLGELKVPAGVTKPTATQLILHSPLVSSTVTPILGSLFG